ncbi:ATP-dependent translocase ABCB1-like isoform X2 [Neocloeon triangulifer]|uniref:ATP-dependent translocase ABCB1-like isoform X2 n=1 Tax=Neocloeon triangulifer TaxID=2078957 RepID=UPI00286F144D|nr:ATP-dependent translocase ABCB1-like isoform X2 [Neocloeon triangulifer]
MQPDTSRQQRHGFGGNTHHQEGLLTFAKAESVLMMESNLCTTDTESEHLHFADSGFNSRENNSIKPSSNQYEECRRKRKRDTGEDPAQGKSGILGLFRCASRADIIIMSVGLFFAVIHGSSFPILALVFGQMTNTFILQATHGFVDNSSGGTHSLNSNLTQPNFLLGTNIFPQMEKILQMNSSSDPQSWKSHALTPEEFTAYMSIFALYYVFIGLGVLVAAFMQTLCWELACERQVYRLRQLFFAQILRQDITWFDRNQSGDLTNKLSDDMERIREGLGSKFSMVVQYVSTFIAGLLVGIFVNWRLTLVILSVSPVLIGTSGYMAKIAASSAAREQLKYGIAGGIAEEVLYSIRTVAAFGGQAKEVERYKEALEEGRWIAMKKYYVLAVGMAVVFFITYGAYGLAFWVGSRLIGEGLCTPGSVFTVFFSVMAGAFSLGNALPFVNAVSTAIGAASTIFGIVDRTPDIDVLSPMGHRPKHIRGKIEFQFVSFAYPTRPEVQVLKDFNVVIEPGNRVALVGSSGAGKSTIVSLLQRFYDPNHGEILLDDVDIKLVNVKWLRAQIGVVSQEPVLFGTTIYENIRYGHDKVSYEEVIRAAKMANAHTFISMLPQKYDTMVGERGAQLSGGQKQRIAIARAIVRDPKILLLDEATSALDTQSESVVQEALDKAMEGRTTIIVAHRLSTIRNANVIYAMRNGEICEWGDHEDLMMRKGLYYSLVTLQTMQGPEDVQLYESEYEQDYSEDGENDVLLRDEPKLDPNGKRSHAQTEKTLHKSVSTLSVTSYNETEIEKATPKEPSFNTNNTAWRLIRLNSPEWGWLVLGLIGCAIFGSVMPVFAFFYGEIFATFTLTGDALKAAAEFWTLMFLVLAIGSAYSFWLQTVGMTSAAEKLVMRLRLMAFVNILRQSIGWFDLEQNSAGKLITRLARDAPLVKGVATESVQNVRTVQSLGKEKLFFQLYVKYLEAPFNEAKKQAFMYALVFSFSQAIIYMMYAGAFRFGAYLIEIGDMGPTEVYRVFFALAFCAASVGQTSAYMQDYTKAKNAANLMFELIEQQPAIDVAAAPGARPDIRGDVEFREVRFRYPSRPAVPVLRGLSFRVRRGQTLALVGASGCGKSTAIALLERFYDPLGGQILIDGFDIRTLNLAYLRSKIGIVTQEPVLFDCSIRDNIAYGAVSFVTDSDIIQAAKTANIHKFIVTLPQGYETMVGERGTQLSGGQKQRVAIARALIRDPKILLLDEATSALDTESEKVVQDALDKARQGRTCIVVAHRLTTIKNADCIALIHQGKVAEVGTHEELRALRGKYFALTQGQKV